MLNKDNIKTRGVNIGLNIDYLERGEEKCLVYTIFKNRKKNRLSSKIDAEITNSKQRKIGYK